MILRNDFNDGRCEGRVYLQLDYSLGDAWPEQEGLVVLPHQLAKTQGKDIVVGGNGIWLLDQSHVLIRLGPGAYRRRKERNGIVSCDQKGMH